MIHLLAIFDKSGLLSTMSAFLLFAKQELMKNRARQHGAEAQVNAEANSQQGYCTRALETLQTGTKIGVMALATSLATPASAQEAGEPSQITRVAYSDNPNFQEFERSGLTRGDRGADQPNRFDEYMTLFESFTPASQDFILRAFNAGKLTEVEEGKDLDFENGKLAANLIGMTRDIEGMARYIETRVIPESRQIPKASDEFDRMLRDFPEVAQVLTPDVQGRILALEDQVIATLDEEIAKDEQRIAALRENIAELREQNELGRQLNNRLEALLRDLTS